MQNRNVWIECGLGLQISISFSEPCLNSQGLKPGRRCLWQVVHHLWTAASASNLSSGGPSTDRKISLCSWREERLDLQSVFTLHCWKAPLTHCRGYWQDQVRLHEGGQALETFSPFLWNTEMRISYKLKKCNHKKQMCVTFVTHLTPSCCFLNNI